MNSNEVGLNAILSQLSCYTARAGDTYTAACSIYKYTSARLGSRWKNRYPAGVPVRKQEKATAVGSISLEEEIALPPY